jgi:hypothetical protein
MISAADPPTSTIPLFVKQWVQLLADNRSADACALLDEPNAYGMIWTPTQIAEAIAASFPPQSSFARAYPSGMVITNPDELSEPPFCKIGTFSDGTGYWFDYAMPLNHQWSDLTAQFFFLKRPTGLAVVLHDLHVLRVWRSRDTDIVMSGRAKYASMPTPRWRPTWRSSRPAESKRFYASYRGKRRFDPSATFGWLA